MKTNSYITFLSALAIFFSCSEKSEEFQPETKLEGIELASTNESIVTTEAQLDEVTETLEYEEEQFSEYDEILEMESYSTELKSASIDGNMNEKVMDAMSKWRHRYMSKNCPSVTITKGENDGFPKTIVLDYGEETVLENGKVLSGIIQIEISARKSEAGATVDVLYQDMTIDTIVVNGNSTKTFYREEGYYTVERELTIGYPEELTVTRTASVEKRWTDGLDTPRFPGDDIKETTGSYTATDSDGNTYNRIISSPLEKEGTCRFIGSGVVDFYNNDVLFATLDYGDGTCDKKAIYKNLEEGTTEEILIGIRKRALRKLLKK